MRKSPGLVNTLHGAIESPNVPRIYDGQTDNLYICETADELAYTPDNLLTLLSTFRTNLARQTNAYKLGAYYFAGWRTEEPGVTWRPYPWSSISGDYANRIPLIGKYPEEQQWVIDSQIRQAYEFGLDFFAFDWYWSAGGSPATFHNHATDNFMSSANKSLMQFCIMAANHSTWPDSMTNWQAAVDYWIANYFADPQYYKINNNPVVIIFNADNLKTRATSFGSSTSALLAEARSRAVSAGYSGIYFISCTEAHPFWVGRYGGVDKYLDLNGYDALTAYNFGIRWTNRDLATSSAVNSGYAYSYKDLDDLYREAWDWVLAESGSQIPYWLPIHAGWDKRPWGGSSDPLLDQKTPTADLFADHLSAAKARLDSYTSETNQHAIIYAWNEIAEGGFIEPSRRYGYTLLEKIRQVFER